MLKFIRESLNTVKHHPRLGGLEILKYIGPGLLVTVGFIDPGNWASNLAAGADYGYVLLWMVSLSTVMLIVLQHNVAHLGIVTGLCLSEAAMLYVKPRYARLWLLTAMGASVSTSLAEILGGAIALEMLFGVPVRIGAVLVTVFVAIMLFTNSYRVIERWIIAFVSIIGLSFIYELSLVDIAWGEAAKAWVTPSFPEGAMVVVMSVLGAVVMPHNLFLHSEIVQSRQWHLQDDPMLKYRFLAEFDRAMVGLAKEVGLRQQGFAYRLLLDEEGKTLAFDIGERYVFVFNWHPSRSVPDYVVPVRHRGKYRLVLDSDSAEFGGFGRQTKPEEGAFFFTQGDGLSIYNINRAAQVFALLPEGD